MRSAIGICGFALICLLALASTARAAPRPTQQEALAVALPIAESAWPGSPCTGRAAVSIVPDLQPDSPDETDVVLGRYDGDCRAEIRSGLNAMETCSVLTHELGHADGQGHSDHGVMGSDEYGPCRHDPALIAVRRLEKAYQSAVSGSTCGLRGDAARCWRRGHLTLTITFVESLPIRISGLRRRGGRYHTANHG